MKDWVKIAKDAWEFIKEYRKWWLLLVAAALAVVGFLIMTAGSAPVPVFVYPVA